MKAVLTILIYLFSFEIYADSPNLAVTRPSFNLPYDPNQVYVFGFKQKDVLLFDGDPRGVACSKAHYQNDLSNKWCHVMVSKVVSETLSLRGIDPRISSILSSMIYLPKEYGIDKKPSLGDMGIFEMPVYSKGSRRVNASYFLDGTVIVSLGISF